MSLPRISVIVPSYNGAKYLRECLDSIAGQDYPDLELIIMDGGSTDETADIVASYGDLVTLFVSEPDEGQTDAIDKGFARATGEVYCWANTDDLLEDGALKFVGQWFADHPREEFVYGDVTLIDGDSKVIRTIREIPFVRWIWWWGYCYTFTSSSYWRAGLYHRVGGMDREFRNSMDVDLFGRFFRLARPRHVTRILSRFRLHPGQRTWQERGDMLSDDKRLLARELGRTPSRLEWWVRNVLARGIRLVWRRVLSVLATVRGAK